MDQRSAIPENGGWASGTTGILPVTTDNDTLRPALAVLSRIRARARLLLTVERAAFLLAAAMLGVLALALADYFLRSPGAMRLVVLLAGLAGLGWWAKRRVLPALRFAPSLTELALRIERSEAGTQAGLHGVLASGVDLARQRTQGESLPLASGVIGDAARRAGTLRTGSLLRREGAMRAAGLLGLIAAVLGAIGISRPDLARIGAARVLLPLADVSWPKRTGIVDATAFTVHPLGAALPLRAVLTHSDQPTARTRVEAEYRLLTDGSPGPWRTATLTSQDRMIGTEGAGSGGEAGALFERLIEPTSFSPASSSGPVATGAAALELEYRFATSDDQTLLTRVLLVEPPAVAGASLEIEEPEYARTPGGAGTRTVDLGAGTDERAAPAPALAGSRARLRIALNKGVPAQAGRDQAGAAWVAGALGEDAAALLADAPDARLTLEDRVWTLEWTLARPVRLALRVVDEHGIADSEERSFTLDVLADNPPSAVVVRPDQDKSLLPTAIVELAGEARDDVGLAWVWLDMQVARRPTGSEGAPLEALAPPQTLARVNTADVPPQSGDAGLAERAARQVVASSTLDLSTLDLKTGDEVWVTALAADTFALGGETHEPVRSSVRKLRIMSRDELLGQVWNQLSEVRRSAIQLEQEQRNLQQAAARPGEQSARQAERAQAGMTERLDRQQDAVRSLEERLEENAMAEPTLEAVLEQSQHTLQRAGQNSGKAGQALSEAAEEAAGQEGDGAPEAGQPEREEARQSQEEVRKDLTELIEMLDQGQDTWAAKRSIEQALQQQKDLRDKTIDAGKRTTGRSAEQLTPQERQELGDLAQEQQAVARETREAIEDMLKREEQMRKTDPAAAQAMAQAAKRGQREQVPEKMEQAGQQVQQNQTNNAQQQQTKAIEAMEQMLQDLEETAKNRDEVLRRVLASLMDSLDALIAQQVEELGALEQARDTGRFAGLDRAMARLHANALGVLEEANNGPREIAPVAALIEEAAAAQVGAIVALRISPVASGDAQGQEELSLSKLREARAAAEKLDQNAKQREQNRKKAELKKQYAAALVRQIALRDSTQALVGEELSRRVRNSARLIGQDQQTLRDELADMLVETRELTEAKVFEFAHKRLDELMAGASDALGRGEPDHAALRRQTSAARVLQALVDALDTSRKEDDEFREQEQSQQGQGGGQSGPQPLVPPAAELRLLRAMQQEAIDMTRAAEESAGAERGPIADDAARLQEGIATQARELLDRLAKENEAPPVKVEPGTPTPEEPAQPQEVKP